MKPTSEILERIAKCSTQHPDGVFTWLYRYLLREDIYYAAYQKLYANKGSTTKGPDDDTADGFSSQYVIKLIAELSNGTYRAKPVRREYIKKANGKMRPLGIPSFRDKLLQEAVRMILDAIYEPTFDGRSHGFRPNRSCHTALRQISRDFTGVVWFIEGDIKGCFDNIHHETRLDILGNKIKDSKFLNIIRQFLKVGYVENWKYNATYSGSPQGGICSPIADVTPEYRAMSMEIKRLSYWIDHTEDEEARGERIRQCKNLRKEIRSLPAKPSDNKKLTFVRYADDWLAGICRTKQQYNAEARGVCNYYNLACDYHTLDYFCYLMEYSYLKTIGRKHKTSIRKIIHKYKDGKTWSVPYETKSGTKRIKPVKIADCKSGFYMDNI